MYRLDASYYTLIGWVALVTVAMVTVAVVVLWRRRRQWVLPRPLRNCDDDAMSVGRETTVDREQGWESSIATVSVHEVTSENLRMSV
jgi:membrane protein implicated in regulation of membrane protease activity